MTKINDISPELSALTDKQCDVLDLVLAHKSSKEIARTLGISHYTVDQRIAAARQKLGASTRRELALIYGGLRGTCGETAYQFPYVVNQQFQAQELSRDQFVDPILTLSDTSFVRSSAPWQAESARLVGLEALDNRFGIVGRIGVIFGLAAATALLMLAMLAIAETLSNLS